MIRKIKRNALRLIYGNKRMGRVWREKEAKKARENRVEIRKARKAAK